jgi:hypothetical protein
MCNNIIESRHCIVCDVETLIRSRCFIDNFVSVHSLAFDKNGFWIQTLTRRFKLPDTKTLVLGAYNLGIITCAMLLSLLLFSEHVGQQRPPASII